MSLLRKLLFLSVVKSIVFDLPRVLCYPRGAIQMAAMWAKTGGISVTGTSRTFYKIGAAVVLSAVFLSSSFAYAQSYDPDQDLPKPTMLQKRLNKMGRGLSNFLFGWTEIPVTWNTKMKQGKPLTYLLTTAPILGASKGVMRMGTGVYEFFTFYFRNPGGDFEPILEPEYIF